MGDGMNQGERIQERIPSLSPSNNLTDGNESFRIGVIVDNQLSAKKKLTKYEKMAKREGIDKFISVHSIINIDMIELKEELLAHMSNGMSQSQYDTAMKIRKKGKNKKAAQDCRRKKQKEIETLHQ